MAKLHEQNVKILVVARWPLGGIRTYMRYVYKHLPPCYQITIVAASTQEDDALERDAAEIGARVVFCDLSSGAAGLTKAIFRELRGGGYSILQSHGFISAAHAYIANVLFGVPHVLTVHGILEERLLSGVTGRIKAALMSLVICNVNVLYAVSNDILDHLCEEVPGLKTAKCKKIVIHNGVDVERFSGHLPGGRAFRERIGVDDSAFVIGFLGRFMQQKGFNYLIDAVEMLHKENNLSNNFKVLAVGSGDYLEWYKRIINEKNLQSRFIFMPFQSDVGEIYRNLDVVAMPSTWEACPLQPMEAMCSGTPLIASNCIGLREIVADTPAIVFHSKDSIGLAKAIGEEMCRKSKYIFDVFASEARLRFDVRSCSAAVHDLFAGLLNREL